MSQTENRRVGPNKEKNWNKWESIIPPNHSQNEFCLTHLMDPHHYRLTRPVVTWSADIVALRHCSVEFPSARDKHIMHGKTKSPVCQFKN